MTFTQPPSGTLITDFEGTENATTLICNISSGAAQIGTTWSIENYRGNAGAELVDITGGPEPFVVSGDPRPGLPEFTFFNELTISTWTADLDRAIIYCGTGQDQREATFPLRVYRKLHDIIILEYTNLECMVLHARPSYKYGMGVRD